MADGRHIGKCWKCCNSAINRPIWTKLGWSHPEMSAMMWLPWQQWLLPRNGALNILQLWASGAERVNQF